jgi:uncharacterized protein YndB with AHSA1/START domain
MESKILTRISKDLKSKKVTITREFDAPLESVWKAWTESKWLDHWWAPKPWVAETKSLKFENGGQWLYAMTGPDGTKIWSVVEFSSIEPHYGFQAVSSFCDENGNKNPGFPTMLWKNIFRSAGSSTTVFVEINFTKVADMEKIIAMGFEAGFTAALSNLDECLAEIIES